MVTLHLYFFAGIMCSLCAGEVLGAYTLSPCSYHVCVYSPTRATIMSGTPGSQETGSCLFFLLFPSYSSSSSPPTGRHVISTGIYMPFPQVSTGAGKRLQPLVNNIHHGFLLFCFCFFFFFFFFGFFFLFCSSSPLLFELNLFASFFKKIG